MRQYSAFLISLVAVAILWGTDNQPAIIGSIAVLVLAAVMSITSFAFAARVARDRSQKIAAGMKIRGVAEKEIRQARRESRKIKETDYDYVPAWVVYAGMTLALIAVLILAYALVVRFLL